MKKKILLFGLISLAFVQSNAQVLTGSYVGRYATGIFDASSTEIVAYDPGSKKLFSVNGQTGGVDVIDFTNPASPTLLSTIVLSAYGKGANSISIHNGVIACAVEATIKQDNGKVVFFNTAGVHLKTVDAGALPDMITFSPDGKLVITANEGEPSGDYTNDPEGSITIVDVADGIANAVATQLRLTQFNGTELTLNQQGVRIYGPGANAAKDLEPEYVTVSEDSKTAWVVCQENNAMLTVDLVSKTVKGIKSFGYKDHSVPGKGLDASDKSKLITIAQHPVRGLYLPDGLANLTYNGQTYILTANEGDAREYGENSNPSLQMVEEIAVKDLTLDPTVFPNAATLKLDSVLGRLNVTKTMGDIDNDKDFDVLYSFGARSFSIWDLNMTQIYDSGDKMEQYIATNYPKYFGVSSTNNTFKNRSDNKGPEPEAVITAKIGAKTFAFVGLERFGGIMIYDVTNPNAVSFVSYMTSRDFLTKPGANTAGGDLAPEGLLYISAENSPNGKPYLLAANEASGSIAVYELKGSILTSTEYFVSNPVLTLNVYPNPNNGTVLNFNKNISGNIYNISGVLVNTFIEAKEISVEDLDSGIYFITTNHNEKVKFIIQ